MKWWVITEVKCISLSKALSCSHTIFLLRGNLIFSRRALSSLAGVAATLRALVLVENPIMESEEYRLFVLSQLPLLERLDKEPTTEEEKADALERRRVWELSKTHSHFLTMNIFYMKYTMSQKLNVLTKGAPCQNANCPACVCSLAAFWERVQYLHPCFLGPEAWCKMGIVCASDILWVLFCGSKHNWGGANVRLPVRSQLSWRVALSGRGAKRIFQEAVRYSNPGPNPLSEGEQA